MRVYAARVPFDAEQLLCRSCSGPRSCAQAPKARAKCPVQEHQPADTVRRANVRELSDTYVLWADLPGMEQLGQP